MMLIVSVLKYKVLLVYWTVFPSSASLSLISAVVFGQLFVLFFASEPKYFALLVAASPENYNCMEGECIFFICLFIAVVCISTGNSNLFPDFVSQIIFEKKRIRILTLISESRHFLTSDPPKSPTKK